LGIWRFGRRAAASTLAASWWKEADALAQSPTPAALAALRSSAATATDPDDVERADEILDGLDRVLALASQPALPSMATQHRVIGSDTCHFAAPASVLGQSESSGKLFVTSSRLVFAGPRVHTWPWHRVRRILREERTLSIVIAGGSEMTTVLCNSYGDAMVIAHMASRLTA
jgi:uncharacterized membrane protein